MSTFRRQLERIALLFVAACSSAGDAAPPLSSTGPAAAEAPSASASAEATSAPPDFREAARRLDWDTTLAQLPPGNDPLITLVRGRASLGAGRHADAVKALTGLEKKLPLLAGQIRRWRAEAAAHAGPFDEAAAFLSKSPRVSDKLLHARALSKAGDTKNAREVLDDAIRLAERTRRRSEEAQAHRQRALLAERMKQPAVAAADWRWLVEQRPTDAIAREALAGVDRVKGALPIDVRLEALADSTNPKNLDETLAALKAMREDDDLAPHRAAITWAEAKAFYSARDYPRARDAFAKVLKTPAPWKAEAMYLKARSTVRSGDPESALALYRAIQKEHPKSMWAERAAYRYAELLLVEGRFPDAAAAFAQYGSRFGKSRYADDARWARAVALLGHATGKGGKKAAREARKLLAGLRDDANGWRDASHLRHLEGVAAAREGKLEDAKGMWLEVMAERPLTYPAQVARARLAAHGFTPPAPIGPAPKKPFTPLPVTLPEAPAKLVSVGLDLAAEEHLHQIEDEVAKKYPGRESEALCELYGLLSTARRRAKIANRAVALDTLMKPPPAAARWAWACIYPRPHHGAVADVAEAHGLDESLIYAVMRQESFFRTTARSPVGARGLMQLMPATAQRAGEEQDLTFDADEVVRPDLNLQLGGFYLAKLLKGFGGQPALAAAGYNAGPHAAERWLAKGTDRELDTWVARIPYRETRHYVQRVIGNLARYQYMQGGPEAVEPVSLALPEKVDIGDDPY